MASARKREKIISKTGRSDAKFHMHSPKDRISRASTKTKGDRKKHRPCTGTRRAGRLTLSERQTKRRDQRQDCGRSQLALDGNHIVNYSEIPSAI